jgi:hypothetical protein
MLHSRRHGDRQRGQIIVLFELVLIVILGLAALVIDGGVLRNNRQILVNTLDSAALAGGHYLPVTGSAEAATANALINKTIQADYPGLPVSGYTIVYKCLIGVDPATNLAWISRDVPATCDPTHAVGHTPVAGDFIGAGVNRTSLCDPTLGDKCNTVVITGSAITQYKLAPVLGLNNGSTGAVVSVACNGPCGGSPVVPVDLVIILDRTGSMVGNDSSGHDKITSLKTAAKAVLGVYDPTKQRVALGLTGPGEVDASGNPLLDTCPSGGTAYGNADDGNFVPTTTLSGSSTTLGGATANTTLAGATFSTTIAGAPFTTTLTTALQSWSGTSATVLSASGIAVGQLIQIDNEVMKVSGKTGSTLTLTRASDGTTRAAHSIGATVTLIAEGAQDATIAVTSASGFPAAPFTIQVDSGANAETMTVTAMVGNNLTVTRPGPHPHAPGVSVAWGGGIGTGDTSITVANAANFPAATFTIQVDTGANAETMLVTNKNGGTTWSVQRNSGGTGAHAHAGGASVSWGGMIGSADTTINVGSASGFPATPFSIQVDTGSNLERMLVTAMSGTNNTTWTVQRGYDGTSARKHASGVAVATVVSKADASIIVNSAIGIPTSGSFLIQIDSEQMQATVSGIPTSTTVLTVLRGTSAATHTANATVMNLTSWVPNATTAGVWVPVGLSGTDSIVPLPNPAGGAGTYEIAGVANPSSTVVQAINCISATSNGTTLSMPLAYAKWYLDTYGRPGVVKGILLETDGHPQDGGNFASGLNLPQFTCTAAIAAANAAKAEGIKIYAVGYGISGTCGDSNSNSQEHNTGMSATTLLQTVATGTTAPYYFNSPGGSTLADNFKQIANDLAHTSAHLVNIYPAPVVTGANGPYTSVTVSGQFFTGATSVTFGGSAATSFHVASDTSITLTAALARASGTVVDVVVTTDGGTSAITSVDKYTYP